MNEFLQKVWTQAEPTIITAVVGIITAACLAVSYKVVQYFNDIRKATAVTQAVAAVQMTSPEGTPGPDKLAAAKDILAADPRVPSVTDHEIQAAVLAVKASVAPVPCPPTEGSGG